MSVDLVAPRSGWCASTLCTRTWLTGAFGLLLEWGGAGQSADKRRASRLKLMAGHSRTFVKLGDGQLVPECAINVWNHDFSWYMIWSVGMVGISGTEMAGGFKWSLVSGTGSRQPFTIDLHQWWSAVNDMDGQTHWSNNGWWEWRASPKPLT